MVAGGVCAIRQFETLLPITSANIKSKLLDVPLLIAAPQQHYAMALIQVATRAAMSHHRDHQTFITNQTEITTGTHAFYD